jgi:hypothetical protein
MANYDEEQQDIAPTLSSRAPYKPPITQKQALELLKQANDPSRQGMAALLLHPKPILGEGLASMLGYEGPVPLHHPGLAGALLDKGITSAPDADPRLLNVTTDPQHPMFQTANGTRIAINKPAPNTMLPWGENLDRLINVANKIPNEITLTGGTEVMCKQDDGTWKHCHGASALDAHTNNNAIDEPSLRRAAMDAGYTHAILEKDKDGVLHWHFQKGRDNIKPEAVDLYRLNGEDPIRMKLYNRGEG